MEDGINMKIRLNLLFLSIICICLFGLNTVAAANTTGSATVIHNNTNQAQTIQQPIIKVDPRKSVYVATTGSDITGTGSLANPYQTIEMGINTVTNGGDVYLANGNYNGTNDTQINITKNVNIIGTSQNGTIINGNNNGPIFNIAPGVNVSLMDLTLTNGTSANGGAITNQGFLTLTKTLFTGNTATSDGGAIYNTGTLIDSYNTYTSNNANYGGALYNNGTIIDISSSYTMNSAARGGAFYNIGNLTVTKTLFNNNNATYYGGAIDNYKNGNLTNINSIFTGNTARYGGAFYNNGNTNLINNNFTQNTAPISGSGGAIYNNNNLIIINNIFTLNKAIIGGAIFNPGTLTICNTLFNNNTSTNNGGAITNFGTLTLNSNTFNNNNATSMIGDGGAVSNFGETLTINKSIFNNNNATYGGAIYNEDTLNITSSTFTSNNATNGGGIYNTGAGGSATANITSSTFTGNNATDGGALYNTGSPYEGIANINITSSTITDNNATDNGGAIYNTDDTGNATVYANYNRIMGNTPSNSELYSLTGTVNATDNWWGSNTNPSGNVNSIVNVTTWLVLTIQVKPATINYGGISMVTADLTHDNNGSLVTGGTVPNGIPITLSTNWGSFSKHGITQTITLNTVNGSVTTVFYANGSKPIPNPVIITATADNVTVSKYINI